MGEAIDGENDRYIVDDKSDTDGIQEATAEAGAVLELANTMSGAQLENDVGLADKVADNIVAYRAGDDEAVATDDDETFDTLGELDSIPFVGPIAFAKLLAYAEAHGLVDSSDPSTVNNDAFDPAACQGRNVSVAAAEARYVSNPELGSYTVKLRTRSCTSSGSCGPWQSVSNATLGWNGPDGSGRLLFGRWDPSSAVKLYVQDTTCETTTSFPERFTVGSACDGIGGDRLSCSVYDTPGICYDIGEDQNAKRLYWEGTQFLFYGKLTENCAQLISHRVRDGLEYEAAILTRF